MSAVIIQEYFDTDATIHHGASKIYPSYEDAIIGMVDYYDTFYLRKNLSLLPEDLQILYADPGFTWEEFTLSKQIIQDRFSYYATTEYGLSDLDFIIGPGVYVYTLDEIPASISYLFSSSILGGKKNRKGGKPVKKTIPYGPNERIVGFSVGESAMAGAGLLSDDTESSDMDGYGSDEDSYSDQDKVPPESTVDESDEDEDMGALAAGLGITGSGFKFPTSIAGGRRFNVDRFVNGGDDSSSSEGYAYTPDTHTVSGGQLPPPPTSWGDIRAKIGF